ncbi:MAG TPA: GNAT family N-acetyltransferase [Devosia sp.]|nr:GNAT family N-acetyltransferase [Devosia sp.]
MAMDIIVDTAPSDADLKAIHDQLIAYNVATTQRPREIKPLAILIKDDAGNTIGGLSGAAFYDWLFIEYLIIPEDLRGQDLGTRLMAEAEAYARAHQLAGIWLDTFSFQARPFYEKLGFTLAGQIDNFPRGGARYFLSKSLA